MSAARALCHPGRRAATQKNRLCVECYSADRRMQKGRRVPVSAVDRLPAGITRYVVDRIPDQCPKCGNRFLFVEGRRVWCPGVRGGCGYDCFLRASA